jgi:hypothetical protein
VDPPPRSAGADVLADDRFRARAERTAAQIGAVPAAPEVLRDMIALS